MIVAAALTFLTDDGRLDVSTNEAYAIELAKTAVPVLLLGSAGEGTKLTDRERLELVRVHASVGPGRLTAVLPASAGRSVVERISDLARLMHAPWEGGDVSELVRFHRSTGQTWMLYSHPARTPLPLTQQLAAHFVRADVRPAGAKVSKVTPEMISELRELLGDDFLLWDGTDRHVSESLAAGADAVVSQAAGALGFPLSEARVDQATIDAYRPDGRAKLAALKATAVRRLGRGTVATRV